MSRPTESEEWLEHLVTQWTQVYKKSMTTLLLLQAIHDLAPASADDIGEQVRTRTGWDTSERAVYRSLRRLVANGLLAVDEQDVPRTGARRKLHTLTGLGLEFLSQIERRAQLPDQQGSDQQP